MRLRLPSTMTRGFQCWISCLGTWAKLMMVRTSPVFPWKAAAPLRTIWPEPGSAGDGVGLEAISVCHIAAQDALVRYEPAFLHQVGGDGQAAFVLQIVICDCGAVNLRF